MYVKGLYPLIIYMKIHWAIDILKDFLKVKCSPTSSEKPNYLLVFTYYRPSYTRPKTVKYWKIYKNILSSLALISIHQTFIAKKNKLKNEFLVNNDIHVFSEMSRFQTTIYLSKPIQCLWYICQIDQMNNVIQIYKYNFQISYKQIYLFF